MTTDWDVSLAKVDKRKEKINCVTELWLPKTKVLICFQEYQRAAADKVKLQMIKFDTKKLEELRKNAVRSAAEFNAEMNAIKKVERRHFWDIQTSIIQSPKNRWRRCIPEVTRPGPYPVALISGQFHEYSSAELRRLPLSTVLDYEYLLPPKRGTSPPPVVVHDEELLSPLPNEGDQDALPSLQSTEDGQSGLVHHDGSRGGDEQRTGERNFVNCYFYFLKLSTVRNNGRTACDCELNWVCVCLK
ncbi:unnamed protein product [Toxocara canis]|uniref:PHM7_ext domain-containing protein n=1 Tax=Toxocara canis TaxID=6265 RepID=A0A183U3F8_TOXCA|nr:unnamed protein product [Toxocara canis]